MVMVRDEGSRFEASIQTVWRYMQMGDRHAEAHRSIRNRVAKPEGEHSMIASMERNWRGNWTKVVNRLTLLPPLGSITEFLEGPFAGSKTFTVYSPEGDHTRVDVYGEFVSPVLEPGEVEKAARDWLGESFDEDAPAVKHLQQSP